MMKNWKKLDPKQRRYVISLLRKFVQRESAMAEYHQQCLERSPSPVTTPTDRAYYRRESNKALLRAQALKAALDDLS